MKVFTELLIFVGAFLLGMCVVIVQLPDQLDNINPQDIIAQEDIIVTSSTFCVNAENLSWAKYTDTKSMQPLYGSNSNGITQLVTESTNLQVGDVVSYSYEDRKISHRIVEMGLDKEGIYYILKGDNNVKEDPYKIRREQIEKRLVAIIW